MTTPPLAPPLSRTRSVGHWPALAIAWGGALWLGVVANWPLWQRLAALPEVQGLRGGLFMLAFVGFVTGVSGALLSLLAWRPLVRPAVAFMCVLAAVVAHFMLAYGTVIDPTMVTNVVQTDVREARDLLSWRLLLTLGALGGVPLRLLWRVRARPLARPGALWRQGLWNVLSVLLGLGLAAGCLMATFADFAATMRTHPTLRYMINPLNALWSTGVVIAQAHATPAGPPEPIGRDARVAERPVASRPPLLLYVVGETARAANFSLNGYARQTNPHLTQRAAAAPLDWLSWQQVSACGTSTAASLPCMFAPQGREAFQALNTPQENLLDVLHHAGLAVLWLDNQSGCKGLCDRVPNSHASTPASGVAPFPPGLCTGGECLDGALLHGLDARLAALDPARAARGVVIVLHQMGNHGPAYTKRSPASHKPFQPECTTNALQQCARDHLVNTYDNGIVYTDQLLAQAADWLQAQAGRYDPALLYVSDHGESLGEGGLYLHGVPYRVAPREQTHVPLITWLPDARARALGIDRACLASRIAQPTSHDALFHSVLRLAGVETTLYRQADDLFAPCLKPAPAPAR